MVLSNHRFNFRNKRPHLSFCRLPKDKEGQVVNLVPTSEGSYFSSPVDLHKCLMHGWSIMMVMMQLCNYFVSKSSTSTFSYVCPQNECAGFSQLLNWAAGISENEKFLKMDLNLESKQGL